MIPILEVDLYVFSLLTALLAWYYVSLTAFYLLHLKSGASSAALLSFFVNRILPPDQFKRVTDKQKTAILRPFVDCLKLTGPKDDVVKAVVPHVRQLLLVSFFGGLPIYIYISM